MNHRRLPSLGQIAAVSPERAYFNDGIALRYNSSLLRIEGIWSIRHICIGYSMTMTLRGESVAYVDLIPAGVLLLGGVTAKNLTAITGATAYQLGTDEAPTLFGNNIPITDRFETDFTHQEWINPPRYGVPTAVNIVALGGVFTGGQVEVTAWGLPH